MFKRLRHWYYTHIKGYISWGDLTDKEKSHFIWTIGHLHLFNDKKLK